MPIRFAFLETIAGHSAFSPDAPPPANLAEAVRENLVLLLNTRQGSVGHLPDYGMPDLADYYQGFPESLEDLALAIQAAVMRYEPRLERVAVSLEHQEKEYFQVTYVISGYLADVAGQDMEVKFHTEVSAGGKTKVSR